MTCSRILIASSSLSSNTHDRICAELKKRGLHFSVYLADRVLSGKDRIELEVTSNGGVTVHYNEQNISPDRISAAWLWKVSHLHLYGKGKDVARDLSIESEVSRWNQTIWTLYGRDIWINAPSHIAEAERKLQQLIVANRVGFSTPPTLATSTWAPVRRWLSSGKCDKEGRVVVKMFKGLFATEGSLRCTYTTPLKNTDIDRMDGRVVPFPGIFQPYISKAREWRVTVVGDELFPASIYTAAEAKDDWRRLQLTTSVDFRSESLPPDISAKCVAYLREFNLLFGAFDLIETPEGEFIFLECNPIGQYGWIEEMLGLPISRAIADRLEERAKLNS